MYNQNLSNLKRNELSNWLYSPGWRSEVIVQKSSQEDISKMNILLFSDSSIFNHILTKHLKSNRANFSYVKIGKGFKKLSNKEYIVNPENKDDFFSLFSKLHSTKNLPNKIIYYWPLIENFFEFEDYFNQLLYLIQALSETPHKICLTVLISNAYNIIGTENVKPEKAIIIGPCKVVNKETNNISCKIIDIGLENDYKNDSIFFQIFEDILSDELKDVIAYRGKVRWVPQYYRLTLPKTGTSNSLLKPHGTYLITGGTGGIGLQLAIHLGQKWKATLILISRTVIPPKKDWAQAIKSTNDLKIKNILLSLIKLDDLGINFSLLNADVTNFIQMQKAFGLAYKIAGRIDGIIYAAGTGGEGMIQLKTAEKAKQVYSAKVEGLGVIEKLINKKSLDFLLIFSSLSSVLGEFGQSDYCSANSFSDSFAHRFEAVSNIRTISVNWGAWAEVGMAVNNLSGAANKNKSTLMYDFHALEGAILTSEGIKMFETLLTLSHVKQVIVSPFELYELIQKQQNFSLHDL